MKRYTVLITSRDPLPGEVETSLNNYASLGWELKCVVPCWANRMMLIFEMDRDVP